MKSAYKPFFSLLILLLSVSFNDAFAARLLLNEPSSDQIFELARQAYQLNDYELARQTFRPIAEAGHNRAQRYMGAIYDKGLGVERTPGLAVYWFEKSAEQGGAKLQYDLGVRYLNGKDVERDYAKTHYWWQKAADAGLPQAQYNLALLYMQGSGVEVDHDKASELLQQAAEQGLRDAQYALGLAYTLDQGGIPLDYDKAYRLFERSAKQGYPSAQFNLAVLTESGEGTTADLEQALSWYRKAAEQGHEQAQERLAKLDGQSVKEDEVANVLALDVIHDQAWITSQSATHYTIQINASHNEESLVRWLKSYQPLAPLAYFPQPRNGKVVYKAIYGSFADQKAAQKALREMPQGLAKLKPWLRRFAGVHGQMFGN